jgi:BirA family biotin operon repressor/biotin-[acetyl-CoA-carboxylase] ligase
MLGDRKLAGLLCEARWERGRPAWVALGIGINVNGPLPEEIGAVAATLDQAVPAGRVDLLEQLLPLLHGLSGNARLEPEEREALAERDWLAGRRVVEPIAGIATGIDADGALLVATDHGTRRVTSGTIRLRE